MRRSGSLDPDDLNRPDWNSLKNNYDKHDVGEAYLVGRLHQMGLQVEHWGIDMRHDDGKVIFDDKMDLRLWRPLDGQEVSPNADDEFRGTTWRETTLNGDRKAYQLAKSEGLDPDPENVDEDRWGLVGVCDVKTKANPDWLGVLNLRHLAHYAEHAEAYDVPVFLYFTMVDMDSESVGEKQFIVPVPIDWDYDLVADHFDNDKSFSLDWSELKGVASDCPIVDRVFRAPDGNPVVQTTEDDWLDFDWAEEYFDNE